MSMKVLWISEMFASPFSFAGGMTNAVQIASCNPLLRHRRWSINRTPVLAVLSLLLLAAVEYVLGHRSLAARVSCAQRIQVTACLQHMDLHTSRPSCGALRCVPTPCTFPADATPTDDACFLLSTFPVAAHRLGIRHSLNSAGSLLSSLQGVRLFL